MPSEATLEKPLPNNLDAERSVLGAILLDNHALNPAIEHLRPEDFFLDQHRRVFTQMISLGEGQQAIDLVTLTDELHCKGELEASGGAPYLASLADGMPRVTNIEHYARIVKEKAILRNLIHATHNIQQRAFEGEDGADAILDNAESSIFALAEDRARAGLLPIKDIVRDNFERLERIFREGKSITGIPTGYIELDKLTSGLQPSEVLILAARPSQGKTALALNLMENIAIRGGHPVAMFSLEMSKESLLQRLVASVAQTEARQRHVGADRRLSPAHHRARKIRQSPRRSRQLLAWFKGSCQRAADPRAGAQPAHARSRARRAWPAALRFARIGRDRAGRRCGDVRLPAALFQSWRHSRRARRNRAAHRQAAQWPYGHGEIRFPQPLHPLRGSRAGCLLVLGPGRNVTLGAAAVSTPHRGRLTTRHGLGSLSKAACHGVKSIKTQGLGAPLRMRRALKASRILGPSK